MLEGKPWVDAASHRVPSEISLCRANHVLAEIYNDSVRSILFFFLLTTGVGQITSAVTLIVQTPSDSVPFLANLFFVSLIPQSILVNLVAFGFGGEFYKSSSSSLKRLKQNVLTLNSINRRDRKFLQAFLNSCQVGKIRFGFSNFIEKTTPLIFQQFCIDRIIDLLLVR